MHKLRSGRRGPVAITQKADRGGVSEMPVNTTARTRPSPRFPEPEEPLPHDVFGVIVSALADALVLDYQQAGEAIADAPRQAAQETGKQSA